MTFVAKFASYDRLARVLELSAKGTRVESNSPAQAPLRDTLGRKRAFSTLCAALPFQAAQ
jgi:hypothetical protein